MKKILLSLLFMIVISMNVLASTRCYFFGTGPGSMERQFWYDVPANLEEFDSVADFILYLRANTNEVGEPLVEGILGTVLVKRNVEPSDKISDINFNPSRDFLDIRYLMASNSDEDLAG